MINFRIVFNLTGMLLVLVSLFMPVGIVFSLYYGDQDSGSLLLSALITAAVGLGLYFSNHYWKADYLRIRKRDGYVIVTMGWICISAFGALPFYIHGAIPSYTDAYFETISGFTTTGASILNDIESMPHGLLFWRSMTHWMGGMGVIVLTLAILPLLGVGGAQLFGAEVSGPNKDKIHPQVQGTAKRLWGIYVLFTLIQTVLLLAGGMNLFDALCHAFGTMSTGGFSTKQASVAAFSPFVHYVIIVFMFLGATNFSLHYHAMHGRFKTVFKDEEFRFYLIFTVVVTLFVAGTIFYFQDANAEQSFRDGAFQVVSIITSTGFVTADYEAWAPHTRFVFLILLFTGGCAGSTTGALKMIRILMLIKNGMLELKRLVHPRAVVPIRFNGRIVPISIINNILAFFFFFIMIFLLGTLAISFDPAFAEETLASAMGAVASTLGCMGPGIGVVGPMNNYAALSIPGKWLLSFMMLLGRLEIFTIFIMFSPSFWKT
ncbi:MAG: TrkH family potassium uptake protein [Leptospiraceae bacterium]|nr:TrkH family potassium uptake protein [Leptospiraceae bacterium]